MKILTAALSLVAVPSQPNHGRSEDFLRGGDCTVALTSDVWGHTRASAREKKEKPSPVRREKKDTGKPPIELEIAPTGCDVPDPAYVGDGGCDIYGEYNTEAWNYDGGYCCESTCVDNIFFCGDYEYDCKDPFGTSNHSNEYELPSCCGAVVV